MIDLDAYFARIGYQGPRGATLDTLRALHALHPRAIPFENLDPLLGRPVSLDLPALEAKLIRARRGGYCFEHNTLFRAVLEQLGFTVTILTARVLWMMPPDAPHPRTHMTLLVETADGPHIADVGFGANLAAAPIRLAADVEQSVGSGKLRLVRDGGGLIVQTWSRGAWQNGYRFTLEPQLPIDVEVANWFTATHPGSRFRTGLMLQLLLPDGRISMLNRRLTRRYDDGRSEETVLDRPDRLAEAVRDGFGLELPADPRTLFAAVP
jgi:N-hydroxyarylamine O-acetyltransferase